MSAFLRQSPTKFLPRIPNEAPLEFDKLALESVGRDVLFDMDTSCPIRGCFANVCEPRENICKLRQDVGAWCVAVRDEEDRPCTTWRPYNADGGCLLLRT